MGHCLATAEREQKEHEERRKKKMGGQRMLQAIIEDNTVAVNKDSA